MVVAGVPPGVLAFPVRLVWILGGVENPPPILLGVSFVGAKPRLPFPVLLGRIWLGVYWLRLPVDIGTIRFMNPVAGEPEESGLSGRVESAVEGVWELSSGVEDIEEYTGVAG